MSKSISSIQTGELFSIRQGIAWYFVQKISEAMKNSQKYPLEKLIQVDQFTVGGKEKGSDRNRINR